MRALPSETDTGIAITEHTWTQETYVHATWAYSTQTRTRPLGCLSLLHLHVHVLDCAAANFVPFHSGDRTCEDIGTVVTIRQLCVLTARHNIVEISCSSADHKTYSCAELELCTTYLLPICPGNFVLSRIAHHSPRSARTFVKVKTLKNAIACFFKLFHSIASCLPTHPVTSHLIPPQPSRRHDLQHLCACLFHDACAEPAQ